MKRLLALGALALALPAAAGAQSGAGLYAEHCATCHGVGGRGVLSQSRTRGVLDVRGLGPPLRGVGARAADFYLRTGYMPLHSAAQQPRRSKVELSSREIDALVAYVA